MSDFIKRLHEERLSTWEQAKAMLDNAASEGRDLSAEEDTSYRAMNARMDEIDGRVTEVREAHERAKASDEAFAALMAKPAERLPDGVRAKDEGDELRSFLRGETAKRAYEVRPNAESRAANGTGLVGGTGTAGGNTIKTSFYDRLIQHLIVNSGMLQAGPTVLSTSTGEALQIPKTTAHSLGTSAQTLTAEKAALLENDPTFGQVTLNSYKYGFLLQVSHELLNDTSVDLMGYLAMQAGRALGNAFGADLIVGTGSNQPQGIVGVASPSGVTAATVAGGASKIGAPTGDNLIDVFYSVIAPYRSSPSAGWMMADATVGTVRKLKDTVGQYLWQPSLQIGAPDLLLGKPIHTDPSVAAVGSAAKSVLFGDFSQYFVRQVESIRFERSDDYAFNTDLVTFRAVLRGDGDLVDTTGAVVSFTGGTA